MKEFQIREQIEELKCKSQHQNSQVLFVQFDKELKSDQRLLCNECLKGTDKKTSLAPLGEIIKKIKTQKRDNFISKQNFIQTQIQNIEEHEILMFQLQETLLNIFKKLFENTQQWKLQLEKQIKEQEFFFSIMEEIQNIDQLLNNTSQQIDIEDISQINKTFQSQNEKLIIELSNQLLLDHLSETNLLLKSDDNQNQQSKSQKDFIYKVFPFQQLDLQKILNISSVETFEINFDDSMIFIGSLAFIIGFNFLDQKSFPQILKKYDSYPNFQMIAASKQQNMFICFAQFNKNQILECHYQYKKSSQWKKFSLESTLNEKKIQTLSLNQDDTELIICSAGGPILISRLDVKNQRFYFLQQLPIMGQNILSISINIQHTLMLSQEKTCFFLWSQNKKQNQWEFQQMMQKNTNIIFKTQIAINENQFLFQDNLQFLLFTIQENRLVHMKKIETKFQNMQDPLFLQSYNHEKQLLLFLQNKQLIFIKFNKFQEFDVSEKTITFESQDIKGKLISCGDCLVAFDNGRKKLSIFELIFGDVY